MNIFIASDHNGIELKNSIKHYLKENCLNVKEITIENTNTDDYPDFAFMLCKNIITNKDSLGILICGNGIGMSIAANKVKGIRAARVTSKDDAFKARNHNGANIIAIGCDLELSIAEEIVDTFINTKNPNEERHIRRINKITEYENNNEL